MRILFLALALTACSSQRYQYVAANSQQKGHGRTEVSFDVPSGQIQVSSMGVVEVEPKRDAKRIPAIHLRLTASNHGTTPWLLDSEEQKVSFPTGGQIAPSFVNSDSALPKVEVGAGELRLLDLYFKLPDGMKQASDLASFSFRWKVQDTSGKTIGEQTALFNRQPEPERAVIVAPYDPYPYSPGWGPNWWGPTYIYSPGVPAAPAFRYHTR